MCAMKSISNAVINLCAMKSISNTIYLNSSTVLQINFEYCFYSFTLLHRDFLYKNQS